MFTIEQIEQAHDKVKTGADFPKYIQELKNFGIIRFETWVIDSTTIYFGEENYMVSSLPKYAKLNISNCSDKDRFLIQLNLHQGGKTDYYTFCNDCALTGIQKWIVRLDVMTCTYYDINENVILEEQIPH